MVFLDIKAVSACFMFELSLAEKGVNSCQGDLMIDMHSATGNVDKDGSSAVHGGLLLPTICVLKMSSNR
jgi:hypothetical protein